MDRYKFNDIVESKIQSIIADHILDWPEDDWYSISDNLDINLYTADNTAYGVVYDVINGQTIVDYWVEVFKKPIEAL